MRFLLRLLCFFLQRIYGSSGTCPSHRVIAQGGKQFSVIPGSPPLSLGCKQVSDSSIIKERHIWFTTVILLNLCLTKVVIDKENWIEGGGDSFPYTLLWRFWTAEELVLRNNNNKGSRSNVNKHELVYGESSSNVIRDAPDVCLSFVLLFTIFIIVFTQNLVLQQSKNVIAKCTETLSPPPSFQFSLLSPIQLKPVCEGIFTKIL